MIEADTARSMDVDQATHLALGRRRMAQNFRLIWLDAKRSPSNEDVQQLRAIVNQINVFTDPDACVDSLEDLQSDKAFLIISDSLTQNILPCIHSMPEIDTIYILGEDEQMHEKWSKVQSGHTRIDVLCASLELVANRCNQNSIAISFTELNEDDPDNREVNRLDPSFMYTELFKHALLDMRHDETEVQQLVQYCRDLYHDNRAQQALIDEFGREYRPERAIWWYTRHGFLYQILNRALRLLEADIIVNMGFFIHDLHRQIQHKHQQQIGWYGREPFVVYRGQGVSIADFNRLNETRGALMSFNTFLSTSRDVQVSMAFAQSAATSEDMVGILFVMIVDPNTASSPFADIRRESYFEGEREILFAMHTVFRIVDVTKRDEADHLYEVRLVLTADDDVQLRVLTECLNNELQEDGWNRVGSLLLQVGQLDKAEELFRTLLTQKPSKTDEVRYYGQLGTIRDKQGEYQEAISFHEKAMDIMMIIFPADHPSIDTCCHNIGVAYCHLGDYAQALSCFGKVLNNQQKYLPENHPSLAYSYICIGLIYEFTGEYSKALPCFRKALSIQQEFLPANHPSLADSFGYIGALYVQMGEYSQALTFLENAIEIYERTLPANHPSLAIAYNSIGGVYDSMGKYSKVLYYLEKSCAVLQKALPENHPSLAISYNNMGSVYEKMQEYSKALLFHERASGMIQKSLPENHPYVATFLTNIGLLYVKMKDDSKALLFYEKALHMREQNLPANHPSLAVSYNNIGAVYKDMQEHSKALLFYEKALTIYQETLPEHHPHLAIFYNNLGSVCDCMEEYSRALFFHEKSLDICQKSLPSNHPYLINSYNSIASIYERMGEHSKASYFYGKAS